VLSNLLINAAKYSPAPSPITVRVSADASRLTLEVRDRGVGIPVDKLEAIFEMFSQVEGAPHDTHGLGIGLTIAKELVELHGGRLTARSEGPGKGATFDATLPFASDPALRAPRPTAAATDLQPRAGTTVLVVDDSRDSVTALAELLSARGCSVRTASSGSEALRVAEEFRPAVVFLDIGMPGMSGLETARRIRSEPWGREMRLVALSGWGQVTDREKSQRAGFDSHLTKPASLAAVQEALQQAADRERG
jgi:CheY-like chemotaxis protein